MAAHDDAAVEAEQEVLADRLDALEHAAVDLPRDAGQLRPRMRRLDLEPLADEHLEPLRGAHERIAFGHPVNVDDERRPVRRLAA